MLMGLTCWKALKQIAADGAADNSQAGGLRCSRCIRRTYSRVHGTWVRDEEVRPGLRAPAQRPRESVGELIGSSCREILVANDLVERLHNTEKAC